MSKRCTHTRSGMMKFNYRTRRINGILTWAMPIFVIFHCLWRAFHRHLHWRRMCHDYDAIASVPFSLLLACSDAHSLRVWFDVVSAVYKCSLTICSMFNIHTISAPCLPTSSLSECTGSICIYNVIIFNTMYESAESAFIKWLCHQCSFISSIIPKLLFSSHF